MPELAVGFWNGHNSSDDPSGLDAGECTSTVGVWYRPGDKKRAWKITGRTLFGATGSAAKIAGLALAQFDSGSDLLLALSSGALYRATPGVAGAWSSLLAGLSGTSLSRAHYNDRHYLVTGADAMRALESGGTIRLAGMAAPQEAPTLTAGAVGSSVSRPSASTGSGFVNPANAYDASSTTFASASLGAAGTRTTTWTTFAADASANRSLQVFWRVTGANPATSDAPDFETGGKADSGFDVTVLFEYSTNSGTTFSTLASHANLTAFSPSITADQIPVTANSNTIQLRATLTYNSGSSAATLRITDIKAQSGSPVTNFSATHKYGICWTDTSRSFGGQPLQGPVGPEASVTLASQNTVTLTRSATDTPPAAANAWRIYRTTATGTWPQQAGLIATVPIAQTTFVDDFTLYASDTQALPLVPMKSITVDQSGTQGTIRVPRDTPPPLVDFLWEFKGSLVGIRGRTAYYADAGRPESWPEIYVITSFALEEHDALVAGAQVGDTCLFAASGAICTTTALPRVVSGQFNAAEVVTMKGQPGCVGKDALITYSIEGEPRCAWVSSFGIHETNGVTARRLTNELDWTAEVNRATLSTAILRWDPERQVLVLAYDLDGDGANERFALIHMAPEHQKPSGYPKITLGHYGKISALTGGVVSGRYRLWSGHPTSGSVYLEANGGTDASNAYDGAGTVPLSVTSLIQQQDHQLYAVTSGNLQHTDFGAGQSATVTVRYAQGDRAGASDTTADTVSLAGAEKTQILVGRSAEWFQYTLAHTGSGTGAFLSLGLDAYALGDAGKVAV